MNKRASEYLEQIWQIGCDYDGCTDPHKVSENKEVESLKRLIDEIVSLSQKARELIEND